MRASPSTPSMNLRVCTARFGRLLRADVLRHVAAADQTVAMHALVVDTANDDAKRFNEGFGFSPLTDEPLRLFLPLGHTALRGLKGWAQTRAEPGARSVAQHERLVLEPDTQR